MEAAGRTIFIALLSFTSHSRHVANFRALLHFVLSSFSSPPNAERDTVELGGGGRAMSSVNIDLKSIHLPLRQLLIWTQLEFFISWTRRKVARVAHLLTLSEIFEAPPIVSNVCWSVCVLCVSLITFMHTLSPSFSD